MDAQQVACQSTVNKVKFWRLDDLLADIGMPGGRAMDDEARFEFVQPMIEQWLPTSLNVWSRTG